MNPERIILDARVSGVLSQRAFRAKLPNGHSLVAFLPESATKKHLPQTLSTGWRVRVSMSPFDMSKGEILNAMGNV